VANLVHLDPWRIEVCFVCFGWCAWFATKIQFASAGIFSSSGPSVCRSMSCPFWVICSCASRLHSEDCFVSQSGWWRRQRKWRQGQVKLAEKEVWCGRLARLEDGQWRYCRFDAMFYEKTLQRWGQRLSKKGRMMRILARQDDLRYVIIKSKAVSLICICSCYFLAWSHCGPIRVLFYVLGLGLSKPNIFLAVYIRRLAG
jgi:hypothetical protein